MRALREAAPDATFTYQHLYLPAGDSARDEASTVESSSAAPRRVGLIDGGVDPADPALVRAHIEQHGCTTTVASRHGTAVAARLVAGAADAVYAADLWRSEDHTSELHALMRLSYAVFSLKKINAANTHITS